jgi:hypothetical protein
MLWKQNATVQAEELCMLYDGKSGFLYEKGERIFDISSMVGVPVALHLHEDGG